MKTAGRTGKKYTKNLELPFEKIAAERIAARVSGRLGDHVKVVFTDNTSVMISYNRKKDGIVSLRLHHMFRTADEELVKAVARYIDKRDRDSSALLNEFIKSNKHIVNKNKVRRKSKIDPCGKYHNLEAVYNRLNEEYFDGNLTAAITWGRKNGKKAHYQIRLGSYSYDSKLIRIHPSLDNGWVPRFFVESIVYHEMLHAFFQVTKKNGRRQYHTPEFRELEKQYRHYDRSRKWEKLNIHRLLRVSS